MPLLPLSGATPLGGGVLPVVTDADVLAVFPAEVRRAMSAPVRDGLVAALTEILKEYQRRASQAAALSDILRSVGTHLEALCAELGVFKQSGESDEALRARALGIPDLVTPTAILAAVNAVLAPWTAIEAKYFESELDCWFVEDGTATWSSFVFDDTAGATPHYPDRLYADDATENGGDAIDGREVLGAWSFADGIGRYFVLRLPPLESVDDEGSYTLDALVTDAEDAMMFVADGSDTSGAESDGSVTSFVFTDQAFSDDLYAAIVSTVELLKGQGIRWQAIVDPLLT
ncbi:MAG: hypothetical protein JWM74_30 [Myxococcaceae bacterium]|nr:hypothetical protein [Myxococcaceae bacterium]